ncbi:hypothetical protein NL676_016718 [Syzygium grande]|nr:hypothetical protein NL676_016718 [Syzygium grande]
MVAGASHSSGPDSESMARLLGSTTIREVRLYGADPVIIRRLADTGARILIGVANGDIPPRWPPIRARLVGGSAQHPPVLSRQQHQSYHRGPGRERRAGRGHGGGAGRGEGAEAGGVVVAVGKVTGRLGRGRLDRMWAGDGATAKPTRRTAIVARGKIRAYNDHAFFEHKHHQMMIFRCLGARLGWCSSSHAARPDMSFTMKPRARHTLPPFPGLFSHLSSPPSPGLPATASTDNPVSRALLPKVRGHPPGHLQRPDHADGQAASRAPPASVRSLPWPGEPVHRRSG